MNTILKTLITVCSEKNVFISESKVILLSSYVNVVQDLFIFHIVKISLHTYIVCMLVLDE